MKWVLANQTSASMKKYQLIDGDAIKLELKYNLEQQTVRISSEETHRLFFIDKTGLWHNKKTILKNEYGVEIGRLSFDKMHQSGVIEVEGKKYHYTIQRSGPPQLVLFEHSVSMPLAVCDLSKAPSVTSLQANKYSGEECAGFLLGLCWYLFPVTAAEKMEYAIV
jgi:hypothetical protein